LDAKSIEAKKERQRVLRRVEEGREEDGKI